MRNIIEIDVLKIDNRPYLTQMTQEVVYNEIYRGYLGLPKENIHGIKCSWRGHPFITIKIKEMMDIDSLPAKFYYMRDVKEDDGTMNEYKISCEIRGVRQHDEFGNIPTKLSRWVKIDPDCYNADLEKLTDWLKVYGELVTEIEEDNQVVEAFDEQSDEEAGAGKVQLGKGLLSVKMEISRHMPEFLPINGKRARIFYRGMSRQCLNCYGYGHVKKDCKEKEVHWLEYVAGFIINNHEDLEPRHYGRWYHLADRKLKGTGSTIENEIKKLKEKEKSTIPVENDDEDEYDTVQESSGDEEQTSQPVAALTAKFDKAMNNEPSPTKKRGRGRPPNNK